MNRDRTSPTALQLGAATPALAIEGGRPVRDSLLPYARHSIDEADEAAVLSALRSEWLTTGPAVVEFERAFAAGVGARHAVAVSSGTAALHAAVHTLDLQPGDEVIVPALTFAATANAVLYASGVPVFADVDRDSLLVDPAKVESLVTSRTRAVIAVDYAGQPCDYDALSAIALRHGLKLIGDACHSLGGARRGRAVGTLAEMTCFSLHPAKAITAGEGGVVTTDDARRAERMRAFRNHGFSLDRQGREQAGSWQYDQAELGYNYRLTDVQCALAASQLKKLPGWIARRREIAGQFRVALVELPAFEPLAIRPEVEHAWHLFVVRLQLERWTVDRATVFGALRAEGIGVQVHYRPVYQHSYYQRRFGPRQGQRRWQCPVADAAYEQILSLPIFPAMTSADVDDVLAALTKVSDRYALA